MTENLVVLFSLNPPLTTKREHKNLSLIFIIHFRTHGDQNDGWKKSLTKDDWCYYSKKCGVLGVNFRVTYGIFLRKLYAQRWLMYILCWDLQNFVRVYRCVLTMKCFSISIWPTRPVPIFLNFDPLKSFINFF